MTKIYEMYKHLPKEVAQENAMRLFDRNFEKDMRELREEDEAQYRLSSLGLPVLAQIPEM